MKRELPTAYLHRPRPLSYLVCLLAVLLLLSLFACEALGPAVSEDGTNAESTTAAPTDPEGEPTAAPPEETAAPTVDPSDRETIRSYLALISALQEEVRALKEENFLLTVALNAATAQTTDRETEAGPAEPSAPLPYTYETEDGEVTILSYTGTAQELIVPSEIDGCPVTEIAEGAFAGSSLTSVVLPATLEELGWFAFRDSKSLRNVTVGSALDEIGYGAFDGCPAALTLICPKDSYAEKYAKSFGIAVKTQ